ncbi:hypothetical protein [Sphingobacterium tabacisoli]|uniref:DUF4833 domain-containing protein n=1 Tax=Sphingobacterium tabacisoli TaxID=2044855 RepID=A0ABW5L6E5_9SPHI|nr:hypothetical protein [Sphingobacterium tabacisoli]
MNNNIVAVVFFAFLLVVSGLLSAQEKNIKEGIWTINNVVYRVGAPNNYGSTAVYRRDKPILKPNREIVDNIPLDYINVKVTNESEYISRVKTLLGKRKIEALNNTKERLMLTFYFAPDGKILDLTFGVKTGTLLTLDEIASIDRDLRDQYRATFSSINNGHKHLYWIAINGEIDFGK